MKVTIEYDLPEDEFKYAASVHAEKFWHALVDIKTIVDHAYEHEDTPHVIVSRIREIMPTEVGDMP